MAPQNFLASTYPLVIIGAGLSGLGLALSLSAHSIPCTVYDATSPTSRLDPGSLQLGPNAMTIFDKWGVHDRIAAKGNLIENIPLKNGDGKDIGGLRVGSVKAYGYSAVRIYRRVLVRELLEICREKGVDVQWGKKFVRVVDESKGEGGNRAYVEFEFEDGDRARAAMLVASDGIYSNVRKSMFPDVKLVYTGAFGAGGSVSLKAIMKGTSEKENQGFDPKGIFLGKQGTFILLPQDPDGTDFMAYKQRPLAELDRPGWRDFGADNKKVLEFFNDGKQDWPGQVRNAIEGISDESMWIWPLYTLPKLDRWTSKSGRIVLIGDAAHAISPASGQGGNMAFEDAYTLARVLANVTSESSLDAALGFWQGFRGERIDAVSQLTTQMMNLRLPTAAREKLTKGEVFEPADTEEGRLEQFRWVFDGVVVQDRKIEQWRERQQQEGD